MDGAANVITVKGNVSVVADGQAQGVVAQGASSVTVDGDVSAVSENRNALGVSMSGNTNVKVGNVSANVTTEGASAMGARVYIMGSNATLETGSVTAESPNNATGLYVFVDGPEGKRTANVTVQGDVTAKGNTGATGLVIDGTNSGVYNIVIDGTVSGDSQAIRDYGPANENQTPVKNVTVWAATPNKEGRIVRSYDSKFVDILDPETGEPTGSKQVKYEYNEAQSIAFEAALNYIVKIADEFANQITVVAEKGRTVRVGDKTYQTAQEGENVKVAVTLDDEEEVNGIYYNYNNKQSLTSASSLEKDGGSFLMKMLRGGAMLLGLDIHTHNYTNWVYNGDATCTQDGTETVYCDCGKAGQTRTKAGTALGHSFTNYVSDGNATCTQDGTKTAKCDNACGKSDTIADEGSALGHSFTNYVSDGNATCTKDGIKTAKCDRCDVTDTIADEGSMLPHTRGTAVQENLVEAQIGVAGSYDRMFYCTVCHTELSRATVVIPALEEEIIDVPEEEPVEEPEEEPEEEPAPQPEPEAEAPAAPVTNLELQYVALDADEEFNGLKVSEQPEMEEAISAIGAALNDADTTVSIPVMEEVLTEEQKETFSELPAEEKLVLTLCALGVSENEDSLSKNGSDLLETLKESADELLPALAEQFTIEELTIDGEVFESFKIEIVVVKDGVSTFQRYTFFNQNGIWKLFQIENGVYVEVVE